MYPVSSVGPPRRPSSVDEAIVGSFGPALPTCGDGRRDSLLPANSPETRERVPINQPESTSRACLLAVLSPHSLTRPLSRRLLRVSVLSFWSLGGRACVFAAVYIHPHRAPKRIISLSSSASCFKLSISRLRGRIYAGLGKYFLAKACSET